MADRYVAAPASSHGGKFKSTPRVIVIHDLEAPANVGMAWSLATGWLQHESVSVHAIADPGEVIDMVPIDTVAWHCGNGNQVSVGIEHTGYASWTFDQWVSGDSHQGQAPGAFDALRNGARKVAQWCKALNITPRWLTPAEVNAGLDGLATHDTMRQAKGGTTHTDPGKNFPYAIYLKTVQEFIGAATKSDPTTPTPTDPPIGGADEQEWYEMAELPAEISNAIRDLAEQGSLNALNTRLPAESIAHMNQQDLRNLIKQELALDADRRAVGGAV